jgi:alpha-L-fucosidase 2
MSIHIQRFLVFVIIAVVLIPSGCTSQSKSDRIELCLERNSRLKLWYTSPAEIWDEALPVGNGRLGAMVFGNIQSERIQLNEESLWGGTRKNNNNPQALKYLPEIRELLLTGRNDEALVLAEKYLVGVPPSIRSYQTLGDLILTFDHTNSPDNEPGITHYRRELDLQSGIASVRYEISGKHLTREVFSSAPDDLMVVNVTGEDDGTFSVIIELNREQDAVVRSVSDSILLVTGQLIDHPTPHQGPGGENMRFASLLYARNTGGGISARSDKLYAHDVNELTLILTAATDYNLDLLNYDRSIDPEKVVGSILDRVKNTPYTELKNRHTEDHQSLFDRLCLKLGNDADDETDDIPTDVRLQRVIEGGEDNFLAELYLQYGRYLLMGSSRSPGRLPANLQGIWNEHVDAPWQSDYHVNINLQMNYWPAEILNLYETKLPLIELFDRIREPGRVTAAEMYGAGGWAMHHLTDIFGRTGLMDAIMWGTFPLGCAWMCLPLWRYYEYTRDDEYLTERIYPVMKESAEFVLDFLIEDSQSRLVTAPSYSPENSFVFVSPTSNEVLDMRLTYASTMDIQIITELFNACIEAGEIVGEDPGFIERLRETIKRLPEVVIGTDGTIREWIEDYEEIEPGHRHISHLFGLHPGTQISVDNPDLFEAARKTIERRLLHGGAHTGWSRAWIINMYARLLDGDEAYKHLLELFRQSTLKNLFDTHPPFQIDGNFGGAAGIAEMLIQSHLGIIEILPALPDAWDEGYIAGLRARGNFEIDIYWENHALTQLIVKSYSGEPLTIRYGEYRVSIPTEVGGVYRFDGGLVRSNK